MSIGPAMFFVGFGMLFVSKDPGVRIWTLGPVLLLLVCIAWLASRSVKSSTDGAGPSPGEMDAWSAAQLYLVTVIFLQMIAFGRFGAGWLSYLLLFLYGGIVLIMPVFRNRKLAQRAADLGLAEDERDTAMQAAACRWSKRAMESLIVLGAAAYAFQVEGIGSPLDVRATVAAIFSFLFIANAIGQWRAAMLYWRDRR
ncbi:hypothetical protein LUR55_15530 [Luteimonas sp. C4P040a]|nr:hypothetical protein [Luteimonas fraxinea]